MDTETVDTVDPAVEIAKLTAEVNAQQLLLDGLDRAIGTLYDSRKIGVERLWDLQSKLATLKHYRALAREAQA